MISVWSTEIRTRNCGQYWQYLYENVRFKVSEIFFAKKLVISAWKLSVFSISVSTGFSNLKFD